MNHHYQVLPTDQDQELEEKELKKVEKKDRIDEYKASSEESSSSDEYRGKNLNIQLASAELWENLTTASVESSLTRTRFESFVRRHRSCLLTVLIVVTFVLLFGATERVGLSTLVSQQAKGIGTLPPTKYDHLSSTESISYMLLSLLSGFFVVFRRVFLFFCSDDIFYSETESSIRRRKLSEPNWTFYLFICIASLANVLQRVVVPFFCSYFFGYIASTGGYFGQFSARGISLLLLFFARECLISPKLRYKFPHVWASLCGIFVGSVFLLFGFLFWSYTTVGWTESPSWFSSREEGYFPTFCRSQQESETCFFVTAILYLLFQMGFTSPIFGLQLFLERLCFEKKKGLAPMTLLFWESLFCSFFCVLFVFFLSVLPGTEIYSHNGGGLSNFPAAICQMYNSPSIIFAVCGSALLVGCSWCIGLYVTKYLSSFVRVTLELMANAILELVVMAGIPVLMIVYLVTRYREGEEVYKKRLSFPGWNGKHLLGDWIWWVIGYLVLLFCVLFTCFCSCVASELGLAVVFPKYFGWVESKRRKEKEKVKEKEAIKRMEEELRNHQYLEETTSLL